MVQNSITQRQACLRLREVEKKKKKKRLVGQLRCNKLEERSSERVNRLLKLNHLISFLDR